jgi:hypothetical protein
MLTFVQQELRNLIYCVAKNVDGWGDPIYPDLLIKLQAELAGMIVQDKFGVAIENLKEL